MTAEEKQVRSFTLSDVPLLRRLAPLGVSLDTVTELTRGVSPINEAFLASLPVGQLGMPTYILRGRGTPCLGLLRHREGSPLAYIAYVAPDLARCADETRWIALIEGLVQAAGERGAHVLNAEVDPSAQVFEVLREVGFALFARQEIWKWRGDTAVGETGALLQSFSDIDTIGVTALYVNIVPKLVQQAIPPPGAGDQGFVYCNRDGHAIGHFTVFKGQRGILLRPLLHPEAYDEAAALIIGVLAKLVLSERTPVYCAVHNYQEWLREPLRAAGFELWARQVVMGKYTLRRVTDPALQPATSHGTRPLPAVTELKAVGPGYED